MMNEKAGLKNCFYFRMCDIIHQRQYKFWMRLDATFKLTSAFKKQIKLLKIIHGLTNKVPKKNIKKKDIKNIKKKIEEERF